MSQIGSVKRRRIGGSIDDGLAKRAMPNVSGSAPTLMTGNIYVSPQTVGDVPDNFSFPAIVFTTQTPTVQQNTMIPQQTANSFATTAVLSSTVKPTLLAPAIAPQPTSAVPLAAIGSSSMSTQIRQGTTTVEAQQGQPTLGLMRPQPDESERMDQLTEKVLIIAGSIAGALILLFIVIIIRRWRQGKKPFSRLLSWRRKDEEEEEDTRPYSSPQVLPFGQSNPHYSTHQKPIWEVNSSINSLPYKPNMAYTRDNSTARGPSPYQAVPSQSRFPPPNRLRTPSPMAEPAFFYRNQSSDSKIGVKVHVKETSLPSQSDSSLEFPIHGPRTTDAQTQEQERQKPSISSQKTQNKRGSMQKDSRFSWTNSQAPKSPPEDAAHSAGTSQSSVARYLTVDSWVGQQTNRLVEYQIQQLFDDILDEHHSPSVSPKTPSPITAAVLPLYASTEILEKSMMDEKRLHRLSHEVSPHHPGKEILLPEKQRIPSAVLDGELISVGRF